MTKYLVVATGHLQKLPEKLVYGPYWPQHRDGILHRLKFYSFEDACDAAITLRELMVENGDHRARYAVIGTNGGPVIAY